MITNKLKLNSERLIQNVDRNKISKIMFLIFLLVLDDDYGEIFVI